jgi:hypothetical protein
MLPVVSNTNRMSVATGAVERPAGVWINTRVAVRVRAAASHETGRSAIPHLRIDVLRRAGSNWRRLLLKWAEGRGRATPRQSTAG